MTKNCVICTRINKTCAACLLDHYMAEPKPPGYRYHIMYTDETIDADTPSHIRDIRGHVFRRFCRVCRAEDSRLLRVECPGSEAAQVAFIGGGGYLPTAKQ